MKILASIILLIVASNNSLSQQNNKYLYDVTDSLKYVTQKIMSELKISIRKNIDKDDPLIIGTYTSIYPTAKYGQKAITPYIFSQKKIDTFNRWYIEPSIFISNVIDSALKNKKDKNLYINSLSTIIHELVHFFQVSYVSENEYIEGTLENWNNHVTQPIELEAYSVEAYFYLSVFYKKELNIIMNEKMSDFERKKKLYNKAYQLKNPNEKMLILK